jgi:hypothetical protein
MDVTVSKIERTLDNDVVVTVDWSATVVVGGDSASVYGTKNFTRDENSPTLVPFADLTEDTVVGWLSLDKDLEVRLLKQISERGAPTKESSLPWVKGVTETM